MSDVQAAVWETHIDKGWHTLSRTAVEEVALVHCELSEAVEAYRDYKLNGWFERGTVYSDVDHGPLWKPSGFFTELADAVIRVMNVFSEHGKDLEEHILRKDEYNQRRERLHGGKLI